MNAHARRLIGCALLFVYCCFWPLASLPQQAEKSLLLKAMEEELGRSMKGLMEKGSPSPYFMSYFVTERQSARLVASYGALRQSGKGHSRMLDVEVRVGDYTLDNTHRLRGGYDYSSQLRPVSISIEDDVDAIKSALWLETDRRYKSAMERLIQVKTQKTVKVEEEDISADFSRETPAEFIGQVSNIAVDMASWEEKLKSLSALFNVYPKIYESTVILTATATNKYLVNSEGASIQHGAKHWMLSVMASTKAEDGMDLYRYESFDAHTLEGLPDDHTIRETIEEVSKDVLALREAPMIEPYTGPAILSGRAAGVFFHEIFGHRIEGHRQKDEEEGQTFTKKVNEQVLPDFISVYDDPTLERIGEEDLMGHYAYDDEGVKAQRVTVVKDGILKNFVMSRSPIEGFDKSNGHGRKQAGYRAVARQGNLIVEASKTVSEEKLREMMIEECKKQDKPFGLIFKDISGGFTFTGRGIPQSYAVIPIMVFRVYTDGRPDELIRGADLIGTPLVSFSKILACGDKLGVFSGTCGAESGGIPVSGVSPSILTGEIEIQKKSKSADRPPLLPPPKRRNQ
ncbi:MAG: TldD/PmbA family protein [Candidatus Aminicenantes bacterium]|nr:MAG: TldD/PmbA family protein [Candidatus Aminicenantes bacterium]